MPRKYSKKPSAKKVRGRRYGRRKVYRRRQKNMDVKDFASLTERVTQTAPDGGEFKFNTLYNKLNYALNQYDRASNVARAYQFYRISGITLTIKPSLDTFAIGSNQTKTYLYYLIDKSGSIPTNITLEGMKKMGAKPIALDEKPITIKWRPSVLSMAADSVGATSSAASKYSISPWLSCAKQPGSPVTPGGSMTFSDVDHLGIYWYVWCAGNGGAGYYADATVNFQYKKPVWSNDVGTTHAQVAVNAKSDLSSDGIVNDIE